MMKTSLFETILSLLDLDSKRQYDILDIGCGSGDFLARISRHIAPESTLVGIDAMQKPIDQARELYPNIEFRQEKFVDSLSFPDAALDIIVSVDTLECISNKAGLVAEAARVLRPGGRILVAHWDWDTQIYNSEYKDVIRKFVAAFSDWKQSWMDASDGQMGRRLWGLFQGSGMFRGEMESFTLIETEYEKGENGYDRLHDLAGLVKTGAIEENEYDLIRGEMKALAESGRYFYSVNSFIYSGKKV